MTDQFKYLNDRMKDIESRVDMLERDARYRAEEKDRQPGSPPSTQPVSDIDVSTRSLVWTIYEFVTNDAVNGHNTVSDILDIKSSQRSAGKQLEIIEQTVTGVRDGIQTIIGMLSPQGSH